MKYEADTARLVLSGELIRLVGGRSGPNHDGFYKNLPHIHKVKEVISGFLFEDSLEMNE